MENIEPAVIILRAISSSRIRPPKKWALKLHVISAMFPSARREQSCFLVKLKPYLWKEPMRNAAVANCFRYRSFAEVNWAAIVTGQMWSLLLRAVSQHGSIWCTFGRDENSHNFGFVSICFLLVAGKIAVRHCNRISCAAWGHRALRSSVVCPRVRPHIQKLAKEFARLNYVEPDISTFVEDTADQQHPGAQRCACKIWCKISNLQINKTGQ